MTAVLRALWRLLPRALRARIWRGLDRFGALPVRLRAGPARGLTILAPASRCRAYRDGRHEPRVLEQLAEHLAPGMQVVDAGAFLGYFTLAAAARVGETGRVWAFEPCAASRALLERSLRRNRLDNVILVPGALGAHSGKARLTRPLNPSMARVVHGAAAAGAVDVTVVTLDSWCRECGARPDLVKIDVEGAELELLAGAAETLHRVRPRLIIELHRGAGLAPPELLVERLRAAGYRVRPLGSERADELSGALRRLAEMPLPPGRVNVLHLVATAA